MKQELKDSINKRGSLNDLTNEELIALSRELDNSTFEDDSPVRKFVIQKNAYHFPLALVELSTNLLHIITDRLESTFQVTKTNKISQKEFNKAFNDILEGSTQRYLNHNTDPFIRLESKKKTSRIRVFDKNDNWLIDYDTDPKNPHFWYSYHRVYAMLSKNFSLHYEEIQAFLKCLGETQFNVKDTIPKLCDVTWSYPVQT